METQYPFFTFSYAAVIYILLFLEISIASNTITLNQSISDGQTLISKGQRFELGFFSPGRSKNRYLAIWYKKTPGTIVWVANKDNPIPDSDGVLISTKNGTLVLLNQTGSVIWSSNSSRAAENPVAQLLESGNLVVIDNTSTSSSSISQNYLWQSFDYLGNTLIQGMKMGLNWDTGRDQYLTSWKTTDDPSTGDSTFKLHNNGLPQMDLSVGMIKKFRTGPWNGLRFSGLPLVTFPAFSLVANEDQFYNFYHHYNDSIATRLVVNGSGLLHMYILGEKSTEWVLMYSVPNNPCDNYGQCGSNSICRLNRAPICHCLKGFVPKSQDGWDMLDWSNGCTRRTRLNCQRGEGFVKVVGINLPDFLVFSLNMSMSDSECRAECLKNCSCTAYANPNMSAGGSGCLMWFKDLIDIREMSEEDREQAIYIRLVASELDSLRRLSWKKRRMIIIMLPTISGMLVLASVLWCIVWRRRKERIGEEWELPLFDFATIAAATNNFCHTNMLGAGGFGPVHKGNLPTGQEIAVKRLSKTSGQGLEEFKNEVGLIAKLQHKNLVRLLGCCVQREERMLIYEYMANKSLDYFIFDDSSSNVLPWQKRLDIVMGIARGLLYLHQDSRLRIIHRDLKTSNILLDSNMIPKISDFGLARIFGGDQSCAITKRVIRTYGYMSPEYALDGIFSVKSDIFSFGVMLLEIVSGKKNRRFSHPDHHHNLLGHAWLQVMDASLRDSFVESKVIFKWVYYVFRNSQNTGQQCHQ